MQHSIVARNVARTAARFVRPSAPNRERRLGLGAAGTAQVAAVAPTALGREELGPFVRLRARWRTVTPAVASRVLLRRRTRMSWLGRDRGPGTTRAPWRG